MRKVIGIGETILDIIFKEEQPIGAVPGGSMFNGLISLGRVGVPAVFISETGDDRVGQQIIRFLKDNLVDASCVSVRPESRSPISLAYLNEQGDADYLFYKDHPHDHLDFVCPDIQPDDIVMFGSFYAVNPVIRQQMYAFLEHAHQAGAILYYDVNYRPSHRAEVMHVRANILENLELADIVRGSDEDFAVMFGESDAERVFRQHVGFYSKNFICTRGRQPLLVHGAGEFTHEYPVEPVEVVSTIGAGDNFNAGLAFGLLTQGITRQALSTGLTAQQWDALISEGQQFAADVCKSVHNSVSEAFATRKQEELT